MVMGIEETIDLLLALISALISVLPIMTDVSMCSLKKDIRSNKLQTRRRIVVKMRNRKAKVNFHFIMVS